MSTTNSARLELIEAGGRTVQAFGWNLLFSQIYTLLYLHPDPLCLDDIADALSVGKASSSIARMRRLIDNPLMRRMV